MIILSILLAKNVLENKISVLKNLSEYEGKFLGKQTGIAHRNSQESRELLRIPEYASDRSYDSFL